ncbi:aldehyde dehydrogenase (NAD+) [Geoalkalibacter ferrihydriticus]|uniref:Aldehyde dehydrogenase n=2 Tax=Geoalkalibacter ferrihydriticus TaxID=392333 RepID=A0A0C2EHN6_9BACT|nr:aldehyde dehydrogenase family protein [Geoalkalibacter ferrihydriticus]KIH78128.1 aldehyde dehydrogenase [Geoalkalibacter ferrihydriticus DSM 17813]SDM80141.1 aldehyde dehydrogenase (NAD+) [Geoalkalibacter ferrihydriticus]
MLYKNFINGEWLAGDGEKPNINPSDHADLIGVYAQADRRQAAAAVAAARAAFEPWQAVGIQERHDILDRIGSEILARREELGRLLSREEGKTLPEGIGEVARAGMVFKYFAGEVLRPGGEHLPSVRPGVDVEVSREPVGVVAVIAPWNFPIAIPAWKIAPALACGNCVLFKPAGLVPGSAWALTEIITRSGLPAGVFNLVMGSGAEVGAALIESPQVDALTFTGSNAVGRSLAPQMVARGARVQLEMGGKNPLVVLDDADLDVAVHCAIQGAFYSTGQRCTASSRLIATDGIHDRFVQEMVEKMQTLRVDDALKEGTDIGPVVDQAQLDQDLAYLRLGRDEGARLAYGGELLSRDKEGFYLSPALFTDTDNSMRINREEIFGPIATVIRVKDYEAALAVANDTEFGLTSGIVTTSLKHASDFKKRAQAGLVMINLPTAGVDYHVPFGGRKGSSFGPREQGSYAREFFTIVKTAYTAP